MNNSFNNWNNNAGRDVNIINQNQPEKIATYEPEPILEKPYYNGSIELDWLFNFNRKFVATLQIF